MSEETITKYVVRDKYNSYVKGLYPQGKETCVFARDAMTFKTESGARGLVAALEPNPKYESYTVVKVSATFEDIEERCPNCGAKYSGHAPLENLMVLEVAK